MSRHEHIEEQVRRTLELLHCPESLPPDMHLSGRILNHLGPRRPAWRGHLRDLAPALLILLLFFNVAVGFWFVSDERRQTHAGVERDLLELLASDLGVDLDATAPVGGK
jgi:hypothetical protein